MRRDRRAKIIATLGPASSTPAQIRALAEAGADVFRLNFSHGTQEEQRQRYDAIRKLELELHRPLGILMDLQGPKLRVGTLKGGAVTLEAGQEFRLDLDPAEGDETRATLPHPEIFAAVEAGHRLLIDDGKLSEDHYKHVRLHRIAGDRGGKSFQKDGRIVRRGVQRDPERAGAFRRVAFPTAREDRLAVPGRRLGHDDRLPAVEQAQPDTIQRVRIVFLDAQRIGRQPALGVPMDHGFLLLRRHRPSGARGRVRRANTICSSSKRKLDCLGRSLTTTWDFSSAISTFASVPIG